MRKFYICDKIYSIQEKWNAVDENADEKLINRELIRLELSLKDGIDKYGTDKEIIVFMHYPPITNVKILNHEEAQFVEIMKRKKKNVTGNMTKVARRLLSSLIRQRKSFIITSLLERVWISRLGGQSFV